MLKTGADGITNIHLNRTPIVLAGQKVPWEMEVLGCDEVDLNIPATSFFFCKEFSM
jgi:hypothetical protein